MTAAGVRGLKWVVRLTHPGGRCVETTRQGTPCKNTGLFGWKGVLYCYRHHPDWHAWEGECRRLEEAAQGLVDALAEGK